MKENIKITIVGLGYVGLPLAVEFSKYFFVKGFDVNSKRIDELKKGIDSTHEVNLDELKSLISPKTKMIVICNPNNPTGAVMLESVMDEIIKIAKIIKITK